MRSSGTVSCAAPSFTAAPGMPQTTLVASSHQRRRTGLAQFQQATRTVVAHAGKDRADGIGAGILRDRTEQHVHRGTVPVHRRAVVDAAAPARAVADHPQVAVAGREIGMAGQDRLAVGGLAHQHRRMPVEALDEGAAEAAGDVLGDDDGRRVGWHLFEHHPQRLGAAGRGTDRDQAVGGAEARGRGRSHAWPQRLQFLRRARLRLHARARRP